MQAKLVQIIKLPQVTADATLTLEVIIIMPCLIQVFVILCRYIIKREVE